MPQIEALFGIAGLWDAAAFSPPAESADQDLVSELRSRATAGDLFFLQHEEEMSINIEVFSNGTLPAALAGELEPRGGAFRLRAPSGELLLGSLGAPGERHPIRVPPGDYTVTPYARRAFDPARYDQILSNVVGQSDWRFRSRVNDLGAAGCLFLLLALALVLFPFTRPYWMFSTPLLVTPWVVHLALTELQRYKRAETIREEYERQLPMAVLVLRQSETAASLPGGWLDAPLDTP
jgi:hypothetical protein